MRIGPTSRLSGGSSGRSCVVFFPFRPAPALRGSKLGEKGAPSLCRKSMSTSYRAKRSRTGVAGGSAAGMSSEATSRTGEIPHALGSTTRAREFTPPPPVGRPHPVRRRSPKPERRAGATLADSYVISNEHVNALALVGLRPLPAASKSGTTTLDNTFSEVLSFPQTQTMAQRNGFEMEEP
jgi:hypothetical protein